MFLPSSFKCVKRKIELFKTFVGLHRYTYFSSKKKKKYRYTIKIFVCGIGTMYFLYRYSWFDPPRDMDPIYCTGIYNPLFFSCSPVSYRYQIIIILLPTTNYIIFCFYLRRDSNFIFKCWVSGFKQYFFNARSIFAFIYHQCRKSHLPTYFFSSFYPIYTIFEPSCR